MTMIDKLNEMGDKIKGIYRINTDCIVLDRKCKVKFDKRFWKEEEDLRWRQNMGGDVYLHEIGAHDPPDTEDTRKLGGMISYHCGPAGHGKTYTNLIDTRYFNPCYVTITNKLVSTMSKKKEWAGRGAHTLQSILIAESRDKRGEEDKVINFVGKVYLETMEKYGVIIVDECSMVTSSQFNMLREKYPRHQLVFCGDIGYQLGPIIINREGVKGLHPDSDVDELVEYTTNYRAGGDPRLMTHQFVGHSIMCQS